jgi:hypothetical protein
MENNKPSRGAVDVTKIVGIVCAAIIVIALITYFAFNDWMASQTPPGTERYESPVLNQLPLLLAFVGTSIGAFVGTSVITGKIAKRVEEVAEKTEKIEKQTNGRTHVRDAQNDALLEILKQGFSNTGSVSDSIENALSTPKNHDSPPEDSFSDEELQIQIRIIQLTNELNEAKKRKEGKENE